MVSDEGLNAYGAVTWGQFFIYQGFNERAGWMHTSSGVDAVDEYLETVTKKGDHFYLQVRQRGAPADRESRSLSRIRPTQGMAEKKFTVYRTHHGPIVREANGKWVSHPPDAGAIKALKQSYLRTKARDYKSYLADHGAEGQFVEQHDLRRRRWRHRLLPRQLHSAARHQVRLDQAGGRQRSRHRMARDCFPSTRRRTC